MPRPVHFEIYAGDPERAQRFYGELFGWTFRRFDGPVDCWTISTGEGPGIDGGLVRRPARNPDAAAPLPVTAWVCTVQVDDLDGTVAEALRLGARIDVEKTPIPGVGWVAYLIDTESNIFGVMQPGAAA